MSWNGSRLKQNLPRTNIVLVNMFILYIEYIIQVENLIKHGSSLQKINKLSSNICYIFPLYIF